MSARNVHPQLGADELLLRVGELVEKLRSTFFLSGELAKELSLPVKLCSDTLGRLYRRGDLTREKLTRLDRIGVNRGICFRYRISKKGEIRLRYLKKRESFYSVVSAVSDPPESVNLNWMRSYSNRTFTKLEPKFNVLRTHPMLSSLAIIDEKLHIASPGILMMAQRTSEALAVLDHLHDRGLVCQELRKAGVTYIVDNAKKEGRSNEEIVLNALFKSVLWNEKQNELLKNENFKLNLQNESLKNEKRLFP